MPPLKTPVNCYPIGCHTRCTRHSKTLYFAPSEDQMFALNVSFTRFGTVWREYHRNALHLGGTVIKFLSRICRLKNARESPSYRMSNTLHSPFQNSLLCAFGRQDFCFKRFYYTIRNSLMSISSKYTSFGGNCNKIFFSNLPALKTPVNRHPIGRSHTLHSPFQNSLL